VCEILPADQALTGCDTTSSFFGIGFDLQTILVQDKTFHLCNHAQEVIQLLALEYVQLTISLGL
jgi:hypothetical protein